MEKTNVLDTAGTMAGVLVLMLIVVALSIGLDRLEARILRWRPKAAEARAA
jgi:ABC-type nitrate/sulfonate/bicarbonate transport system permease component